MNPSVDYANLYKDFSAKLRKKIFRKPNVVEARDDFAYLAKTLAAEDSFEYAAIFTLGKARCEANVHNYPGEASALMEAGRLFLKAEENLQITSAFSVGEFLECFTSCCLKAAKIFESIELLTSAASCYIYVGDNLMKFERFSEAIAVLSHAADIFCRDAPRSMHVLFKCMKCQLFTRDYPGALNTILKMQTLIQDACETHGYEIELFLDDLHRIEVFRVLLVLTVLPPKSEELVGDGQLSLLAYTDDAKESAKTSVIDYMDRDLVLLLRSLVMSYQLEDVNGFELTATLLQPYVDYAQRKVLCDILTNLIHPPDDTL
uniref:Nuclear pore complex protein n=2 Tax=Mesocestoides corti TaxID=53468 RepID=A0A5K3FGM6_MESCO